MIEKNDVIEHTDPGPGTVHDPAGHHPPFCFFKTLWYSHLSLSLDSGNEGPAIPGISEIAGYILTVLRILTRIFIIFYFLRWSYRMYTYLKSREEFYYLSHSPSWTVWAWIVPVMNLFYPYLIMRDIYESLRPERGWGPKVPCVPCHVVVVPCPAFGFLGFFPGDRRCMIS